MSLGSDDAREIVQLDAVHLNEQYNKSTDEDSDDAWFSEARTILSLTGPLIIDFLSSVGLSFTDTLFLGHIGATELSAASLGVAWTLLVLYLFIGIAFGLDSVVSQAHGAQNPRLVDRAFQTCLYLMILGSVPVMISYAYTEQALLIAGQIPEVAYLAGVYAKWLIIGVLPTMVARASVRYLQMRGLVFPSMITGFLSLIINIILNFILINGIGSWAGLGFIGAAISTVLSRIFSLIALWAYMYYFKPDDFTWTGWHADAFTMPVVVEFLKYGVPSSLMFWLEETSFNLLTLLVGLLHLKTATVASAVALSVLVISFVIPIAFGSAAASRLGYLLGANRPIAARSVAIFAAKTAAGFMLINSVTLFVFRRGVVNLFLSKAEQTDEVVKTIMSVLSVLCVTLYFDGQQIVAGCLIRGVGFPTSGFVTNLVAHYVITNPVGALFAFVFGMGVMGFYYGLTIGLAAAGVIYGFILFRIDWKKAAAEAHQLYATEDSTQSSSTTAASMSTREVDIVPDTA